MSPDHLESRGRDITEQNRTLMRTAYDAFGRGDIPTILDMLHPSVEWTDAEGFPTAGTYVGLDAVKGMFARVGSEFARFAAVPSAYVADGDHVVVLGEYGITHKVTGRSATVPFAHVWRLEEGRIRRFRQFTDGPAFQRVAGVAIV